MFGYALPQLSLNLREECRLLWTELERNLRFKFARPLGMRPQICKLFHLNSQRKCQVPVYESRNLILP
jgi:hypothetical protein